MANRSRKFKRQWVITAEGMSRGKEGELTFVEEVLNRIFVNISQNFGQLAQDTKIDITTEDIKGK